MPDIRNQWLDHAALLTPVWTWSVDQTIPAASYITSPIVTPAALVNPNTQSYPDQEPVVGHILRGWLMATGAVAGDVHLEFRFPTGSNTWWDASQWAMPTFYADLFTYLTQAIVACVPQIRIRIQGHPVFACNVEGAFSFYTQ